MSSAEKVVDVAEVPEDDDGVETTTMGLPPLEVEREFERRIRCGTTPRDAEEGTALEDSNVMRRAIDGGLVVTTVVKETGGLVAMALGGTTDCCCCCCSCNAA